MARAYFSSTIASTSTAAPAGRLATPTAARACRPASPNTATMRSEAPFTHLGASVNSGVRVHEAAQAQHARDAVEVAAARRLEVREDVEAALAAGRVAVLDGDARARGGP